MKSRRIITIDFDQFSENDPAFKRQMIDLMIENLEELESAYYQSSNSNDPSFLSKAYHKVKTTLVMLNDEELDAVIEDLKNPDAGSAAISHYKKIRAEITSILLADRPEG
ncbi:MAG: hypothetical protein ABIS36_13385 [Chryseolinea sp.]